MSPTISGVSETLAGRLPCPIGAILFLEQACCIASGIFDTFHLCVKVPPHMEGLIRSMPLNRE